MSERGTYRTPIGSEGWLLEQQMRAEWEAEEWRRIRTDLAQPRQGARTPAGRPWHEGGSIVLKGVVRFAIGAFGGWMGYIAAANSEVGEFEIWLAIGAGFVIALALSAVGPARQLVALLAEILRWSLILTVAIGGAWMVLKSRGA